MMRRAVLSVALIAAIVCAGAYAAVRPAFATIKLGTKAPDFTARASIGGRVFTFHLDGALERGPVVLYFYPAAFTPGCTIEAHDFAAHMGDFHALGATVIGVSGDDIAKLRRFSVSDCRSKFAVAADPNLAISREYDAVLMGKFSNRTSYVIARDGTVAYAYTDLNPDKHVANALSALRRIDGSRR